jgi:hypothetical protein
MNPLSITISFSSNNIVNNMLQSSATSSSFPSSSPSFRRSSFLDLYQVRLRVVRQRGGARF